MLLFRNHLGDRFRYQFQFRYQFRRRVTLGIAIMVLPDNLPILCCRSCGGIMKLVRTVPRLGGLPELHFVSCSSCNDVEVKEETRVASA